jgi:hypothetical protein
VGYDLRKRGIWATYPASLELREEAIIPGINTRYTCERIAWKGAAFDSVLRIRDVSRILIFIHPRIPDLGSRIQQQHQKRRGTNLLSFHFCSYKNHKIVNNFIFEQVKNIFC